MGRYAQTCPIIYGEGTIKLLGEEAKKLGCTNVMLVSGKTMVKSTTYALCKQNLIDEGINIVEFNKVVPDPPDYIINEGGSLAKVENVDGIVAVGGGSAMDAAKAINVLVNNELPINQYFGNPFYTPGVPVIMIVTTSGTGSESTSVAVVTDTIKNVKNSTIGNAALGILDPQTTVTVPPHTTAHTAMDAFSHAAESITAKIPNPKSEILAKDAIHKIVNYLPIALKDGNNLEARGSLLLASNFAGIAFNDALVHLGHAIAHSIGNKFHITHGIVCALALPEVMIYASGIDSSKVKIVGEAMNLQFSGEESDYAIGEKVAQGIRLFLRSIAFTSLKDLSISKEHLIDAAELVLEDVCYQFVPKEVSKEEIRNILSNMYDNF
ncbi:MAG: iron-containing alcohol dehydrogenase [Eubacteriales bacterium]